MTFLRRKLTKAQAEQARFLALRLAPGVDLESYAGGLPRDERVCDALVQILACGSAGGVCAGAWEIWARGYLRGEATWCGPWACRNAELNAAKSLNRGASPEWMRLAGDVARAAKCLAECLRLERSMPPEPEGGEPDGPPDECRKRADECRRRADEGLARVALDLAEKARGGRAA